MRLREGAFLIEGPNAVLEALRSGISIEDVFVTEDAALRNSIEELAGNNVNVVPDKLLRAISDTDTPQGVVAIAERPVRGLTALPDDASLVLVLAAVRDPGNAGTLLRSATAAGADAVVFAGACVDPYGPKTVRASAGSMARLVVIEEESLPAAVDHLRKSGLQVLATDSSGGSVYERDLSPPIAFVLGNEAWGLDPDDTSDMDGYVGIPMPGPVESLNVGIAGSVLLFEALRQRRD